MTTRQKLMLVIAAAALAAPVAGSAQSYEPDNRSPQYGQPAYGQQGYPQQGYPQDGYGQPGYDHRDGDFHQRRRGRLGVYPQFRAIEGHIQYEIQDGLREDLLMPDDAQDLTGQLRQIQYDEMREYRVHGWNLPWNDQARIQGELNDLDRTVDEIRNQQ